jgi:hypothetical protein
MDIRKAPENKMRTKISNNQICRRIYCQNVHKQAKKIIDKASVGRRMNVEQDVTTSLHLGSFVN